MGLLKRKPKVLTPEQAEEIYTKDFFDMINNKKDSDKEEKVEEVEKSEEKSDKKAEQQSLF